MATSVHDSILQFRRTGQALWQSSQGAQAALSSLGQTLHNGAEGSSDAMGLASDASHDTTDVDSSSLGQQLQSAVSGLQETASQGDSLTEDANGKVNGCASGIGGLLNDLGNFSKTLPPGATRNDIDNAAAQLLQASSDESNAQNSTSAVGYATNNVSGNLISAGSSADTVAGDTEGQDVSSAGSSAWSSLQNAQTGFFNGASDADQGASSQGYVTSDLSGVNSSLDAALQASGGTVKELGWQLATANPLQQR